MAGIVKDIAYGPVEEDPEYSLIVEANNLASEMDNEILIAHKVFIQSLSETVYQRSLCTKVSGTGIAHSQSFRVRAYGQVDWERNGFFSKN